ncbi:inositol monophosphatase [Actinoplanes sp. NPDC051475]|uniref:inositol monophosphatase family protein n=1 Tax=Actinoplanes sp. NPDC051475 TaxID=3157225 RepID=UPI00344DF81C
MDSELAVEVAEAAARRAGELVRREFLLRPVSHAKGGRFDRVTAADCRAEDLIRSELLAASSCSMVIGEERGITGNGRVHWYVDPIDGTYNFARGIPLFCVSIGVVIDAEVRGGCVYDVIRDEMFSAAETVFRINGRPAQRHADGPPLLLTDVPDIHGYVGAPDSVDVRRIGSSALALAWVAAGRADLAANVNVYAWDIAAGQALVRAAGGGFAGLPDEELRTDRRGGFVAWGPGEADLGSRLTRSLRTLPRSSALA